MGFLDMSTGRRERRGLGAVVSRYWIAPEEKPMAFKPNYNHQRAERNRAKDQKKQDKRRRRDDEAARRKGTLDEPQPDADMVDTTTGDTSPDNPSEDADGPQETKN
jgi:hypothetical protein